MEPPQRAFWLIRGRENHWKVLTLRYCFRGPELVPLFGSAEEAEDFLFLYGAFGGGFRISSVGSEELLSLLEGAYSHVDKVALDPVAGMDAEEIVELVSMDRRSFVEVLSSEGSSRRGGSPRPPGGPPGPSRTAPSGCRGTTYASPRV